MVGDLIGCAVQRDKAGLVSTDCMDYLGPGFVTSQAIEILKPKIDTYVKIC